MILITIILYAFVKIQFSKIENISEKEKKQLKNLSVAGIVLSIPGIVLFLISGGKMASIILVGGTGGNTILMVLSAIMMFLHISNWKKIRTILKNGEKTESLDNKIEDVEKKKEVGDFYALLISVITLPVLIFLYCTNVTEKEVKGSGAWATTRTVYSVPDNIQTLLVLLLLASIVASMYIIMKKGQNNSNKATWVKIINVINAVGGIVLLSI